MKKLIYFTCLSFLLLILADATAKADSRPKKSNYLFFLHNKFTEDFPLQAVHQEYGRSEYLESLDVFRKAGFIVLSEKRAIGTDVFSYAKKIVKEIDSLLKSGVKPNHITVVGLSKGGYIAQLTSTLLANPEVNFVFIGSFREQDLTKMPQINFCGNILTIYDKSDEFGVSAIKRKEASKLKVTRFKELELNTNLKHGFLFKPLSEWVVPVINWGKRRYASV